MIYYQLMVVGVEEKSHLNRSERSGIDEGSFLIENLLSIDHTLSMGSDSRLLLQSISSPFVLLLEFLSID